MNVAKPESCERLLEAEFEVHTGADEIFSQSDADGNWRTARSDQAGRCRAVHSTITEIDIEIFDLGGPIVGESQFESTAKGPARLGMARGSAVEIRLHIGESAAGRGVDEYTIHGITGVPACRRQPIIAGLAIAAEGADAGGRASIDCGIVLAPSVPPTTPPLSLTLPDSPFARMPVPMGATVHLVVPQPQPPFIPM